MKKIINFLSTPFLGSLSIFFFWWICASLVEAIAWVNYGKPAFAIYLSLHGFIISYFLVLISTLIPLIIRKIWIILISIISIINVIIDVVCHYNFHFGFVSEVVDVIRGTNINESLEFLDTFISIRPILYCASIFIIIVCVYLTREKTTQFANKNKKIIQFFGLGILIVSLSLTTIKKSQNWGTIHFFKIITFIEGGSKPAPQLKEYRQNFQIAFDEDYLPNKVVVILGESHASKHSSIYGYEKKTEPRLERFKKDSTLFIYKNVESPAIGTIQAFTKILNSSMADNMADSIWYKSKTIFDLAKKAGYYTMWISNQDQKGVYDNIPASHSELCDTSIWAAKKMISAGRMNLKGNYDQAVIDLYNNYTSKTGREFIVFHLMGSHEAFENRFPESFAKFKPEDYEYRPINQRQILADYDNSILYNDSIITEIINIFSEEDAIVFYFSDHSLDVFDSSDSFFGHARPSDLISVKAGKAIPFFIYTSHLYKSKRPETIEIIKNDLQKPFNTGFFFQKMKEILGINIIE